MPTDTILRVENLEKTYRKGLLGRKGHKAIAGVSLEVGRGTVFGLLGPNGAGKTTLIKVLLGLVRGYGGRAEIFGQPAGKPVPRERVGYLPEAHRLPPYLTGWEVMRLFGQQCGRDRKWLDARIPHWLGRVGMAKDAHRKIREYSKGMQQRVGLAQALVHEPELVFLDEPTDGVDPVGRKAIREIVQELKEKGVTIFVNSHLLAEVEQVSDRVVIMKEGVVIEEGTIQEVTAGAGAWRIEVTPLPENAAGLFDGLGNVLSSAPLAGERGLLVVELPEEALDTAIDRLRGADVGIRGLAPTRRTLEDAFIDLVKEDRQ